MKMNIFVSLIRGRSNQTTSRLWREEEELELRQLFAQFRDADGGNLFILCLSMKSFLKCLWFDEVKKLIKEMSGWKRAVKVVF